MASRLRHVAGTAGLALRVLLDFGSVRARVHRVPLPALTARLASSSKRPRHRHNPWRLSRAVDRTLRLGGRQPTCLVSALVLFKLLRAQGEAADLVIGLPSEASTKDAHAWVELRGRDLGPAPGRTGYLEFARYPVAVDGDAAPGREVAS